jgi:hypothetical protein
VIYQVALFFADFYWFLTLGKLLQGLGDCTNILNLEISILFGTPKDDQKASAQIIRCCKQ